MAKKMPELRLGGECVVSRKDPTKILGTRPEDFPDLLNSCKVAAAIIETRNDYRIIEAKAGA